MLQIITAKKGKSARLLDAATAESESSRQNTLLKSVGDHISSTLFNQSPISETDLIEIEQKGVLEPVFFELKPYILQTVGETLG